VELGGKRRKEEKKEGNEEGRKKGKPERETRELSNFSA
jgi:hypothetical protein